MKKVLLSNIEQIDLVSALNYYISFYIKVNQISSDIYNERIDDLVTLKEKIQNA